MHIAFFTLIVWGAGEEAHKNHRDGAIGIKQSFNPVEGSE
jgi:hypothetical protein